MTARTALLPEGADIVVRANPAAAGADAATLAADLDRALPTVLRRLKARA
jgi:ribonuclease P protein component